MPFQTSALDLKLLLLINQQWRFELLDFIMPILSSRLVLLSFLAVALVYAIRKGGKQQIVFFLILFVGMGLSDLSTNVIKKQVQRIRPLNELAGTYHTEHGPWQKRPANFVRTKENGTSFPSAHCANTMCLAVLAMLFWPALKKWPLLLPLLVGYSRLYLGKHYPTDVLGGWFFGLIIAGIVWLAWNRFGTHFRPEIKN
ncbi:MAG: phosphatase PAP2 family protein [Pseudodesulfovibrio sp.]|nr:phosphatase PAP2 family protein [Pseudodesulfovibrio sp.]